MTGEKKASATKYHRRALMTAADRLLTEHGYDGMNMNMLAKEANYSKATVYVYFESKDEIVRALAIERLTLFRSELKLLIKSDLELSEKLTEIRSVFTELATEDRVYFDFVCDKVTAELSDSATDSEKALASLVDGILTDLTALLPRDELLNKWYAFYGKTKTNKMFDNPEAGDL